MSNQCAVASWRARNRVIGGSSVRREQPPHALGDRAGGDRDRAAAPSRVSGGSPPAARMALTTSRTGRGSPELMKYARPEHGAPGASASSAQQVRARRVVDVGRVDHGVAAADEAQPARRGRGRGCAAASWVSPGPQIRCGRSATVASASSAAREHQRARPPPWSAGSRR